MLYDSDEYRALLKTICEYVEGASVRLPKEIVSDYPKWSPEE